MPYRRILAALLCILIAGCTPAPPDPPPADTTAETPAETSVDTTADTELIPAEMPIWRCDTGYFTDEYKTNGIGSVTLTADPGKFTVTCRLYRCTDGCDPADLIHLAVNGYAAAYSVTENRTFTEADGWPFSAHRYGFTVPDPMIPELQRQGVLEQVLADNARKHFYLVSLDETYYAVIQLRATEDNTDSTPAVEAAADEIVRRAVITYTPDPADFAPTS